MHRLVSIAGTEEQVDAAKREIQRLIGTFAGVGEYDDSTAGAPQWSVLSSMHSLFSGSLDLQQLHAGADGQPLLLSGARPACHVRCCRRACCPCHAGYACCFGYAHNAQHASNTNNAQHASYVQHTSCANNAYERKREGGAGGNGAGDGR